MGIQDGLVRQSQWAGGVADWGLGPSDPRETSQGLRKGSWVKQ